MNILRNTRFIFVAITVLLLGTSETYPKQKENKSGTGGAVATTSTASSEVAEVTQAADLQSTTAGSSESPSPSVGQPKSNIRLRDYNTQSIVAPSEIMHPMAIPIRKIITMIDGAAFENNWSIQNSKDAEASNQRKSFIFKADTSKEFTILMAPESEVQNKEIKKAYILKFDEQPVSKISLSKIDGKKTKKLLDIKQKSSTKDTKSKDPKTEATATKPEANDMTYWIKFEKNKISIGLGNDVDKNEAGSYEDKDPINDKLIIGFKGSKISLSTTPKSPIKPAYIR